MYKHYPPPNEPRSFSKEDIEKGMIALHTDFYCPVCGKIQSVAQMGGYDSPCIRCGYSVLLNVDGKKL